jgi:hypothetical protein
MISKFKSTMDTAVCGRALSSLKISCAVFALGTAFSLMPVPAAKADPAAYEVTTNLANNPTNLFGRVDLATGAFTQTSALSFIPAGLAEVGSNLYTSVFVGGTDLSFYQLNPATGGVTLISDSGLGGGEFQAIGSTLNTIYALDDSFNLYSVNPTTGAATLIGATGLTTTVGYQLSTGSSTLYFGDADELYTLNTSTGAATDIGPTVPSEGGIDGLVEEDGVLYGGFTSNGLPPSAFYSIDPTTGASTFLTGQNPAVGLVYGLAPTVPEPFTLSIFGAGLAGAAALRRRRKAKA